MGPVDGVDRPGSVRKGKVMVDQAPDLDVTAPGDQTRTVRYDDIAACTDLLGWVERRLAECQRARQGLALLCIDVAGRDEWIERYGPDVAHRLLHDVALRLRGSLRQQDELRRLSAKRFAVLLCGAGNRDAHAVRARLERALGAPYQVGQWLLGPRVRIGCAASPPAAARAEALVHLATPSPDTGSPGG